jgi:hypothetical protein
MISNNFDHVGRTLGPEISKQAPPVGMALDQLEKELQGLRDLTQRLGQRLSPVLRPVPEETAKGMLARGGGSQLANQIESLAQLARFTSADIAAMLDCLEI